MGKVIIFLLLSVSVAAAQDFKVEMIETDYSYAEYGQMEAEIMLTNNSGRDLGYCKISVALLKGGKTVAIYSRPWTSVPAGAFSSETYYYKYLGEFDQYRYSITNVKYGVWP